MTQNSKIVRLLRSTDPGRTLENMSLVNFSRSTHSTTETNTLLSSIMNLRDRKAIRRYDRCDSTSPSDTVLQVHR